MVWVFAAGVAGFLPAQDFSKLSDAERKQVNDWMAERTERMIAAHRLDNELSQAWGNEAYTSPEIEALRQRYRELQQELGRAQAELKKKVMELPEVQEKRKLLEQERKSVEELSKKVKEKTEGDAQRPLPNVQR
jgi:chromosome segregation ATPase